mmetsp:Transcript_48870/g.71649  ORF Transcript_48870/g.71649 Transcript_48870/m.71649 type:complete len:157 (+) Transcript_48870:62-532(+)
MDLFSCCGTPGLCSAKQKQVLPQAQAVHTASRPTSAQQPFSALDEFPSEDLPKLVCVLQSWIKQEFISDPETALHCIDLHEGELVVAFREGSHGWYFGRVVHESKALEGDAAQPLIYPTEIGREGWFPPSFCKTVAPLTNETSIGGRLLRMAGNPK